MLAGSVKEPTQANLRVCLPWFWSLWRRANGVDGLLLACRGPLSLTCMYVPYVHLLGLLYDPCCLHSLLCLGAGMVLTSWECQGTPRLGSKAILPVCSDRISWEGVAGLCWLALSSVSRTSTIQSSCASDASAPSCVAFPRSDFREPHINHPELMCV